MDFRNSNPLNSRANLLSGNLLPMTPDDSRPPILWRAYRVIILLIEVVQITAFISGFILVPREKALKDGTVGFVVTIEVIVMLPRFYARKKLLKRVIGKLNDLLRDADETMEDIMRSILKPKIMPLTLYGIFSVISLFTWNMRPILLAFNRNTFFYSDYNLPAAFSAEPFSTSILIPSILIMTFGGVTRILKKYSLDVYMVHLVLLLTAQYRYTAMKLAQLFRHPRETGGGRSEADQWMETELRTLCQHYNTVIRTSLILKKLLSLNFSLIFLTSVLRFCFLCIMITTIPSLTFTEGISVLLFAFSTLMQFFLLCSSVQLLLNASTEITDKAFHGRWYQYRAAKQRIFLFFIMANNLECKLAAIEKLNLSLPSFIMVINQSYSIALLFLKIR